MEPDRHRGLARLRRHHERDRELFAARPVAGPVRQQIGREARIADDAAMRAAIGEARHRARVEQHLARRIEVAVGVIEERHVEHAAPFIGEHGVIGELFRPPAFAARAGAQRVLRRLLVVRRIAEQIHLVVVRPEEQRIVGGACALAQDRGAHLAPAQSCQPLGERQFRDRLVARMGLERIARQLQPEHQSDRTRGDLRCYRQPARGGGVDLGKGLTVALRRLVVLRDREGHGASGVLGHPQHHRQIVVDGREVQHELQHAAAFGMHRLRDRGQFILAGLQGGREVAGGGAVIEGARSGEAERA